MNNFDSVIIKLDMNNDLGSPYLEQFNAENSDSTSALGHSEKQEIFCDNNLSASITEPVELIISKLQTICRCCITENSELRSLFEPSDYIASMINMLTTVQPIKNDGLPDNICIDCLVELTKCINFKQQIEAADLTFRQILSEEPGQEVGIEKLNCIENDPSLGEDFNMDNLVNDDDNIESDAIHDDNDIEQKNSETLSKEDLQLIDRVSNEKPVEAPESTTGEINSTAADLVEVETFKETKKTKRRGYVCKVCDRKFSNHLNYIRHIKYHPESKTNYWCTVCYRNFKDKSSMQLHLRCHRPKKADIEDSKKAFKCTECEMAFSTDGDLHVHGSIHDDKLVCRKCNKEFTAFIKLKRHIPTHFEDKPYKCEMCNRGFPEMGSLTKHFRLHTGEKREKTHKCTYCDKSYYDAHALSVHIRTHTGEKPWVCNVCGKAFIDARLLNSHLKTHRAEKMYECDRCGKRFTHQSTLTTHIRVHTGEKPYVCVVCNKSFIQSSNLSLHMRVHSGEKPYKCKHCPRAFASSSTLTTHMRTHTGEKPYSCPQCSKTFARHDLSAHMRTHTGEKPFSCVICSRKFTTSGQLSQHIRSHTGEKPYNCTFCKKKWASSTYLKKHLKTHLERSSIDNQMEKLNKQKVNATYLLKDEGEFQSDSEFDESAVLVNDLLAAVDSSNESISNSVTIDVNQTIDPNILRLK